MPNTSFRQFLTELQFEEQATNRFFHPNTSLYVYFVETNTNTYANVLEMQKQVIELRKEGAKLWVVRQSVWEKKEALIRRMMLAKLNKLKAVFARDLQVVEVSEVQAKSFLENFHLLGFTHGNRYLGLKIPDHRLFRFQDFDYLNKECNGFLAIAIFGKTITRKKIGYEGMRSLEWIRLATIPSIRLVGGITKFFEYCYKKSPFDDIMTYVDIENNDAKGLMSLGFKLEEITPPLALDKEFNLGNYKLRYVK